MHSFSKALPRSTRTVLPVLLALFSGCSVVDDNDALEQLRDEQRRWRALNIDSYTFEMQYSCFCGSPQGFVRITVQNDSVRSMIDLATNQPIPSSFQGQFGTIDQIFEHLIQEAEDADDMRLGFHRTYHYPAEANVDRIKNAIDDEFSLSLRNFLEQ